MGALWLVGCGESFTGPPRVELGVGLEHFEPLAPAGGTVNLIFGPQGGWHLEVSARIGGMAPDRVTIEYIARDAATGAVLSVRTRSLFSVGFTERDGDWIARPGDRLVLGIEGEGAVLGRVVTMSLEASEAGVVRARDERTATVVRASR